MFRIAVVSLAELTDPRYSTGLENRIEGILRENVFDVGQEQFLMLLFVVQTQSYDGLNFSELRLITFLEQLADGLIDRVTKVIRLRERRP